MTAPTTTGAFRTPSLALRSFDLLLTVLALLLSALTVAAIPLLALLVTGRGPITFNVQVDPPYAVTFDLDRPGRDALSPLAAGQRSIEVHGPGRPLMMNFPSGREYRHL